MRRSFAAAALVLSASLVSAQPVASSTAAPAVVRPQTYAVVRSDVTYVDSTRGTAATASTPARRTRTIPVMILRPDSPGRFPLVVFVHGASGSGPTYESFLRP